jgi:phosphatidate cytidylyltransferase
MLKHRLFFGALMVLFFVGLVLLGGWLDGSITRTPADDKAIKGSILCGLLVVVAALSVVEMTRLAANKGARVFTGAAVLCSIAIAMSWYARQFDANPPGAHLYLLLYGLAASFFVVLLYQGVQFGTEGVLVNCGVTLFTILYIGFLGGFILGIRIDFGPWVFLMFIFTVKCSDIGAYTLGRLFGRHKFAPRISPKKTWEGAAGAVIFGAIAAVGFAHFCDIMGIGYGILFGCVFGFLGQLGDLAESMLKRDAGLKDSSSRIPGFGGILDVIDSPLATAPAAYLWFVFFSK